MAEDGYYVVDVKPAPKKSADSEENSLFSSLRKLWTPARDELVFLVKLPEDAQSRQRMIETFSRITDLANESSVTSYLEITRKSEFTRSSEENKELRNLKKDESVKEYLDLRNKVNLNFHSQASIEAPLWKYGFGDFIEEKTASKDTSFKSFARDTLSDRIHKAARQDPLGGSMF